MLSFALRGLLRSTTFGRSRHPRVGKSIINAVLLRRPLEPGQYLSLRYTERLALAGIEPSVGSRGDSYDNALAETIIGLYKTELIELRGPWSRFEDVELATLEYVWWFNNHRLLEPIGDIPPAEFEEQYRSRLIAQPETVGLKPNGLR